MSIFPDDDKRRKSEDDLTGQQSPRHEYDQPPKPNPPGSFKGGAIKMQDGTRIALDSKRIKANGKAAGGMSRGWGCVLGLVIVLATVVPILLFVVGPMTGLFNVFGEDTREVPGDASAFDPIASFAEIEAYARGEAPSIKLIDIKAMYVKSDGTLDLTAESYFPTVTYEFVIPAARPENAPPIGAGGSTGDYEQLVTIKAFRPGQMRTVTTISGGTRTDYTYQHLGLERKTDDPRPVNQREIAVAPACSLADLWEKALHYDAPRDSVAIIDYDGEYSFNISAVNVDLTFDQSCKRINR